MPPKSKKITETQQNIENVEIKEKKVRKSKKNVEPTQHVNEVKEEIKSVEMKEENRGKKMMKNELLKEIYEHKHLNEDAKKFLTNFFVNYKNDFIYEENYNQLMNNIIGMQEKKSKIAYFVNHLNLQKQYKKEYNKNKFKFYKPKASKPILTLSTKIKRNNTPQNDSTTNKNSTSSPNFSLLQTTDSDNNTEFINRVIKEETCFSASLQDLLSLYLYKIYLAKDKKEESDTKSILPNDNHSEYFYSYFVIQLNNNIVKLAPYVVKIDKYFNFKNEVFKNTFMMSYNSLAKSNNYENDIRNFNKKKIDLRNFNAAKSNLDTLENINLQHNHEFLIKSYLAEFKNKYIGYSKKSTNETLNLLFNDANLYNAILNNSILDHIQYKNKNDKNYILNNFLQLFDHMDDKQIYFNMIDISYIQEFYNFYLELYGEKNIKSIQFLWDFDSNVSDLSKDNVKNMICSVIPNKKSNRIADFENSRIGFHNLEKYLFNDDEIQYLKDMFPYKLENCLSYSFSNYQNIESLLSLFTMAYESRLKKNLIIAMMGDKEEEVNHKNSKEDDLWTFFDETFFEKYGTYLNKDFIEILKIKNGGIFNNSLPKSTNYVNNTMDRRKHPNSLYNDTFSEVFDCDINDFDKDSLISTLQFLKIFTLEQFTFYIS